MSIWIANKNEYGEYQFDERYLPEWYTPEYIEVGTLRYYRYIIRNKDTTFYIYSVEKLNPNALEKLESDWIKFFVPC